MSEGLLICNGCSEEFPEDEIHLEDQLCTECYNERGIQEKESRMDLD